MVNWTWKLRIKCVRFCCSKVTVVYFPSARKSDCNLGVFERIYEAVWNGSRTLFNFPPFPSTIIYLYDFYCYFYHSGILFLLTATRLYLCVHNESFSKSDFKVNVIFYRTCKMKPEQNYNGMGSDIKLCLQTYIVCR